MEPFFSTKPAGEGTGLGLSMAHGIVAQHEGAITIESEPGRGTSISISLPAIPAPMEHGGAVQDTQALETGDGRVLLAEPHAYARQIMSSALETIGFEVMAVADGPEMEDALSGAGEPPVLTVLEARLPGVEVPSRLAWLRALGYGGPVLLVGQASDADAVDPDEDRVIVLRKPVRVSELKRLAMGMTRSRTDRRRTQ
jgi:CheY-like chemotaxis protein